jgi:uncharacterized protein
MNSTPPESKVPPRRPVEPGYLFFSESGIDPPHLLGTRCRSCGERFFPLRATCAKCLARDVEDVLLSETGTLYSWSHVRMPLFKSQKEWQGYFVGQIDLPEGVRIQSLVSTDREHLEIGETMTMELQTVRVEEDGTEVVTFRFRPDSEKPSTT